MSGDFGSIGRRDSQGPLSVNIEGKVHVGEDGRVYVKVTKDGQFYRLAAEGMFGERLRSLAEEGRNLNAGQLRKISDMVDKVFFAQGPVTTTKTLDVAFADDVTQRVNDLCSRIKQQIGEEDEFAEAEADYFSFVRHTSFGGSHEASFTRHVADSYIALCRDWGHIIAKSSNAQSRVAEKQDQQHSNLSSGLAIGEGGVKSSDQAAAVLSKRTSDLESQIKAMSNRLTLEPDNEALKEAYEGLRAELAKVKAELAKVRQERDDIAADYAALREAHQAALADRTKDETPELKRLVAEAQQGMNELRGQKEALERENLQLREGNSEALRALEDQVRDLEGRSKGDASALLAAQSALKDATNKCLEQDEAHKTELAELKAKLAASEEQKAQAEAKLVEAHQGMSDLSGTSGRVINDLQSQVKELSGNLTTLKSERDSALERARNSETDAKGIRAELSGCRDTISKLEGEHSVLLAEHGKLQGELAEAKASNNQILNQLKAKGGEAEELNRRVADLSKFEAESKRLTAEIAAVNGDRNQLQHEITALKAGLQRANDENLQLSASRDELVANLQTRLSTAEGQSQKLNAENQRLQATIAKGEGEIDKLMNQLSASGGDNERLVGQLRDVQNQRDELNQKLEKTSTERDELTAKLATSYEELQAKRQELNDSRAEVQGLKQTIAQSQLNTDGQIAQLRSSLSDKDSQLAKLKGENDALSADGAALTKQLAGARSKIQGLGNQLKGLQGEKGQVADDLIAATLRSGELTEKLATSESALAKAKADLESQQKDIASLTLDIQKLVTDREASKADSAARLLGKEGELLGLQSALREAEGKSAALAKDYAALQGEQISLRGDCNAANAAVREHLKTITDLTGKGEQLSAENAQLLARLTATSSDQTQLSQRVLDLEKERSEMSGQITNLTDQCGKLQGELTAANGASEAQARQNTQLLNEKAGEINDLKREVGQSRSQVEQLDSERQALLRERADLKDQAAQFKELADQRLEQLQSANSGRDQTADRLAQSIAAQDELKNRLESAEQQRDALQTKSAFDAAKIESLVAAQTKSEENIAQLTEQLTGARKDLQGSQSQADELNRQLQQLERQSQQNGAQIRQLTADLEGSKGDKEQLTKQLGDGLAKQTALKAQVDQLTGMRTTLTAKIAEDKKTMEGLRSDLDSERQSSAAGNIAHKLAMDQKEAQLSLMQAQMQTLSEQLTQTAGERDELQGQLKQSAASVQRLNDQVQQLGGENARLVKELASGKAQQATLEGTLASKEEQLKEMSSQLAQGQQRMTDLSADLKVAQEKNRDLEGQVGSLNRQIESLQTTVKSADLELKAMTKQFETLQQFIESDPAVAELKPIMDKMQREDQWYVNQLSSNAVFFSPLEVNGARVANTIKGIGERPTDAPLTQQDISAFTTAAFYQIARGQSDWKGVLAKNEQLAKSIPPQLRAFSAGEQASIAIDTSKQAKMIADCKQILLSGTLDQKGCAEVVKTIETGSRELIRELIKHTGIDNPPLDLNEVHKALLQPKSVFSRVVATFKPEVKEQLCILAYYQNAIANLHKRRPDDTFSTHDQWSFLYKPTPDNDLFVPKPENLLHLVDSLKATRLQGLTLSGKQMGQVANIFGMMNKGTQSANMFSPAGSGKTTIVELTMMLTGKLTNNPPEFHYVSSIPSTIKDVKSHLLKNLNTKEVNGVTQYLLSSPGAKGAAAKRQIVFVDEAHLLEPISEFFINGSSAQNVRITATPAKRTSAMVDSGFEIIEKFSDIGKNLSKEYARLSTQQELQAKLKDVEAQLKANIGDVTSDPDEMASEVRKQFKTIKSSFKPRDYNAKFSLDIVMKAIINIPETLELEEHFEKLNNLFQVAIDSNIKQDEKGKMTKELYEKLFGTIQPERKPGSGFSTDTDKFKYNEIMHLAKVWGDLPERERLKKAFLATDHDKLVNLRKNKDQLVLRDQFEAYNKAPSFEGGLALLESAKALRITPSSSASETTAMRLKAVADEQFATRTSSMVATLNQETEDRDFYQQLEKQHSYSNLSERIREYAQVKCNGLDDSDGIDKFTEQMVGKTGIKNQMIFPNFELKDDKVNGFVDKLRTKLKMGNETAFIYTNEAGDKKALVGERHINLSQLKDQKDIAKYVMLYDSRIAAGGDYEEYSKNNAEDASIRQFILVNTEKSNIAKRSLNTSTLVQAYARLRQGTHLGGDENNETYLYGNSPKFGDELTENNIFNDMQKARELDLRGNDVHELATDLGGFIKQAYSKATGGDPKKVDGVYNKIASAMRKASTEDLMQISKAYEQILASQETKPAEAIQSMISALSRLGIEASPLASIRSGLEGVFHGDLAPEEKIGAITLDKSAGMLGAMTGVLQAALQAKVTVDRLAKSGSAFAARAA